MSTGSEHDDDGSLARVLELAQTPRAEDPADVIHRVIDQCLISMVFQPIVELRTGQIFAYEALCRSRVPQFDSPPALIEAATAVGRVGELGRLQRSLASRNCPDWPIFVNISPNEFDEGHLVQPDDAIFRHRKPVYVEITESVPLVFFEQCHSVLAELRRKGACLAIDDLGAGYSNLKYIADLKPDIVKLDRELVAGCALEGHQYELLRSIAQLCGQVNARVVAEGVENPEELDAVTSAGIDFCQGFFLGRPKISPSELSWPASELVVSAEFQVRRVTRIAEQCEATAEGTGRRLEELEEIRALLERSVRKAKGEVVRLRKAVAEAETNSELARARLTELESSLEESESNRRRMARLFEAAARNGEVEEEPRSKTAAKSGKVKQTVVQGLIWAAGLMAGLMLYMFDPKEDGLEPRIEAEPTPVVSGLAATPKPAQQVTAASASDEIRELVLGWAAAWSARDVEDYFSHYTTDFVAENGLSGEVWRAQRRDRLTTPGYVGVAVSDLEVFVDSESAGRVIFLQSYDSDGYSDHVRKQIDVVREADGWRIARESSVE